MRRILQVISWLAIAGTILPSFLYLLDAESLANCQRSMLVATIAWFVVTPCWMGRGPQNAGT
jgi:hypothetical protein